VRLICAPAKFLPGPTNSFLPNLQNGITSEGEVRRPMADPSPQHGVPAPPPQRGPCSSACRSEARWGPALPLAAAKEEQHRTGSRRLCSAAGGGEGGPDGATVGIGERSKKFFEHGEMEGIGWMRPAEGDDGVVEDNVKFFFVSCLSLF
jgi:hypothetical protein